MTQVVRYGIAGACAAALCLTSVQGASAQSGEPVVIGEKTVVRIHYTLTVDGTTVDSSLDREPFEYRPDTGEIISGLDRQLMGLRAGDERDIAVAPAEGYGLIDPDATEEVPITDLPITLEPKAGMRLTGRDTSGRTFLATIKEVNGDTVVLDLNHPLAGKALSFHVKVVDVQPL